MEMSVFFAKLFGIYMLIAGLAMLMHREKLPAIVEDMFKNSAYLFESGAWALLFGLVIVLLHNVWESSWRVVITVIGYLSVLKGIMRMFFPDKVKEFASKMSRSGMMVWMSGLIVLVGAFLTYHGFWA